MSDDEESGYSGKSFSDIKDVAVYMLDITQGKFLYMGQPVFQVTGQLPQFFAGKNLDVLFEIICDEDFSRIKEKYAGFLWKHREKLPRQPEITSDVFRILDGTNNICWIENTMVILNYSGEYQPQKALGYLKQVNPSHVVDFRDRVTSLRRIIMGSNPPHGIAQLSALKNWKDGEDGQYSGNSLLEVAFHGALDFKLTHREREVLLYIANGFSAREIASMLFISESTVVTHRRHLIDKFQVKNVAELIKEASRYFHFN